jgi:hypothetical protein
VNSLDEATKAATDALTGNTMIERPDVKSLPTMSPWVDYATLGLGKYVTRALEASDVFTRTMVYNGELESLMERYGSMGPLDEKAMRRIRNEAMERAKYFVFRGNVDAANKSGQGDVLSAIDAATNAVYGIRDKVPGARWLIRFVQTPMNILKQGIEYSPAGVATLKGAKDKREQLGKAIVGSLVFAGGYAAAMQGRSTWALPKGEEERKAFMDAGRVPYSYKIGDTWVSYSKLGGLAYPLAMASALHYYETEGPKALSDTQMEKAGKVLQGIMGFFSDQSYVQGIGDLVKTAQGDPGAITRLSTTMPSQLIPLSSLQGWVNAIIDPLYRQPEKGFSVNAMIDNLKSKIVGLSQTLEPKKDLYGKPAVKDKPILNAVLPTQIKTAKPVAENILQGQRQATQYKNKAERQAKDMIKQIQQGMR